jgi:pyruvate/2-oxoglutarate dehydrogenase complex dihydrolipoamide acyltransferase (E2) component
MADFKLPDLGEGVTEAEIDRWLVKEGQEIAEDDLLVEVITDKATAEIPSPYSGVVARIHVGEGEVVPVGTVLVTIGDAAEQLDTKTAGSAATIDVDGVEQNGGVGTADSVKAMPPVRRLARELGVDITKVRGTGPEGRVVRSDVEKTAGLGVTVTAPSQPPQPQPQLENAASGTDGTKGGERIPFRGVRRMIGEHMLNAHLAIPAVTHVEQCDVTEIDSARKLANQRDPGRAKLTFLPFVVKAVVLGLKQHPILNSSLDEDRGEIVLHNRYDIGIAVDTPAGLMVPVVKDADKMSLRALAGEIERLALAAKNGKLSNDERRDSTFSITSPGPFGGLMATPIINHPNAAILGVHRAAERPVVRDGQIVARLMMNLSITFDHRLMDGVTASRFCMDVVQLLEHPAVLALEG